MNTKHTLFYRLFMHIKLKYLLILWHLDVQEHPLTQECHLFPANQEILEDPLGLWDQAVQECQGNRVETGNDHNFEFFHSEVRLVAELKNKEVPPLIFKWQMSISNILLIFYNIQMPIC